MRAVEVASSVDLRGKHVWVQCSRQSLEALSYDGAECNRMDIIKGRRSFCRGVMEVSKLVGDRD